MKNTLFHFFIATLLTLTTGAKAKAFTTPDHYLVSYELKYTYTQDSLNKFWKRTHIPSHDVEM